MKKNVIVSILLLVLSIGFTILVKFVDVQAIGPEGSMVGFSLINKFFNELIGVNMGFYKITEYLGYLALLVAACYALIGFIQLIKRKSLLKVDKEIFILAGFYVLVVAVYAFFEVCIINYRPTLIDGVLEASYPSSHTLLALCICGSGIIINKKIFQNKYSKVINFFFLLLMIAISVGRVISGVHWFTDIIGGILISITLLTIFNNIINKKAN